MIDCVYVAASAHDARFTRTCIASVRYFYPRVTIKLLAGGPLTNGLAPELERYWGATVAAFAPGDYGWGFVKLEPLFGNAGERFLVVDSDTVLAGPILDGGIAESGEFVVDDEQQTDAEAKRLYYDWDRLRDVYPNVRRPGFVFNTGQWFGTAGVLTRRDFDPWVKWTMPRQLRHSEYFMPGEQGVLNLVLNERAAAGEVRVERQPIMRWPGHGMQGINAKTVASKQAPPLIVHWAGMKHSRSRQMVGSDVLRFFERRYYEALPGGSVRRHAVVVHRTLRLFAARTRLRGALAWCRRCVPPRG